MLSDPEPKKVGKAKALVGGSIPATAKRGP